MHKKLTCDQRRVFNYVRKCFEEQSTFYNFITGGAGVGKSYLTSFLVQYMRLCTASVSGTITVSLCAPTWVASY